MTQHDPRQHDFADPDTLATALAHRVAGALSEAINARGAATLAVSGGSTPAAFFRALSAHPLPWGAVTVLPVDERFVPPDSERSNEKLIRENLLQDRAAQARFIGLWSQAPDADHAAQSAEAALGGLGKPLDVVILGMGGDGHTASFFPDSPQLEAVTDPRAVRCVLSATAPSAGEPRLTLTLPLITSAHAVILHIEGADKRQVLADALAAGDPRRHPISAVLNHLPQPLDVFWAPKKDEAP